VYLTNLLLHVYNTVPSDVVMARWWQKSNRCPMLYTELQRPMTQWETLL